MLHVATECLIALNIISIQSCFCKYVSWNCASHLAYLFGSFWREDFTGFLARVLVFCLCFAPDGNSDRCLALSSVPGKVTEVRTMSPLSELQPTTDLGWKVKNWGQNPQCLILAYNVQEKYKFASLSTSLTIEIACRLVNMITAEDTRARKYMVLRSVFSLFRAGQVKFNKDMTKNVHFLTKSALW